MDGLQLLQRHTCFVEPIRPSGFTPSGLYVLDHDEAKDLGGNPISMIVRVLETHPTCVDAEPDTVCVIRDPYNYEVIRLNGRAYYMIHERNLQAVIEGYDEDAA